MLTAIALVLIGFAAGFVDTVGGGGGLLTLPSLLVLGLRNDIALGTNKGQAIFGLSVALARFARSPLLDRRRVVVSFAFGFLGSLIGALTIVSIPEPIRRSIVIVLLLASAVAILIQRTNGKRANDSPAHDRPAADSEFARRHSYWLAILIAVSMGFYDGFFGPGVGIFLIVAYASLWREPLDQASANAKVVNCASGLAAVITFGARDLILWKFALPMAVGQIAGGYLGAHTVIKSGRGVVRIVVVVMALAQVAYLGWRIYRG